MSQPESSEILKAFALTLKSIRQRRNLSQEEMSEFLDVSTGQLANWETARNLAPMDTMAALADKLEVTIDYLLGRVSGGAMVFHEGKAPAYGGEVEPVKGQNAPIVSMVQAGRLGSNPEDLANQIDERQPTDCTDKLCFWVRVENDSMITEVKPGDLILAAPNTTAISGQIVIAKLREQESAICKLYHQMRSDMVKLTSYNRAYPELEYPRSAFDWIYPMWELRRKPMF